MHPLLSVRPRRLPLGTSIEPLEARIAPASVVSLTGGNLAIIDGVSGSDSITVSVNGTKYRFSDPGGLTAGGGSTMIDANTVEVLRSAVTSFIIQTGGGNDSVTFSTALSTTGILTVDTGIGSDSIVISGALTIGGNASFTSSSSVTFNNSVSLAVNRNLSVNAGGTINLAMSSADLSASGTGTISLTTASDINLATGSSLQTVNGALTLSANQQVTPTNGGFSGITIDGTIQATGTGVVSLSGTGASGGTGNLYGVRLTANALVSGGSGPGNKTIVTGIGGGASSGTQNYGVRIDDLANAALITSLGGNVVVTGTGGDGGNNENHGVALGFLSGRITAGGSGNVTVTGTAGVGSSGVGVFIFDNSTIDSIGGNVTVTGVGGSGIGGGSYGIYNTGQIGAGGTGNTMVSGTATSTSANSDGVLVRSISKIGSAGGTVQVTGASGSGSYGINFEAGGQIFSGGNQAILLFTDSLNMPASATIASGFGPTSIAPLTAGTFIDLGGADVLSGSPLTLGLTNSELSQITAGVLQIGDVSSGMITISAALTPAYHLTLDTGSSVHFDQSVTMGVNLNLTVSSMGTINLAASNGIVSATGTGTISMTTARDLVLLTGSSITTVNGSLTLSANAAGTATGDFIGVDVNGASVSASGLGVLMISGIGGDNAAGLQHGVRLQNSASISGGSNAGNSTIVTGTGGNTAGGIQNIGILIDSGTITSAGGDVLVTGTAGDGATAGDNTGVYMGTAAALITAGGLGTVTVTGTGGNATSSTCTGVDVRSGAQITSTSGNVTVTGTGGSNAVSINPGVRAILGGQITSGTGGSLTVIGTAGAGAVASTTGIQVSNAGSLIGAAGGATILTASSGGNAVPALSIGNSGVIGSGSGDPITINTDSIEILGGINSGVGVTTITPRTAGTLVDIGGADVLSGSPLTLGLTDAELDLITAGTLQIDGGMSGDLTVSVAITNGTNLALTSGADVTIAASLTGTGTILLAGNNVTGGGPISTGGGLTVSNLLGGTLSGVISGSTVTKSGPGTLALSNSGNSFTGFVTVSGGTLQVASDGALGNLANQISLNGGTLQTTASFASGRGITSQFGGAIIKVDVSTTLDLSGVIDGVGDLTKSGAGTLILGGVNTFGTVTSSLTITAGTLKVSADSGLGDAANVLFIDDATLQTSANFTSARAIFSQATAASFQVDVGTTLTLSGSINGTGGLQKAGMGTLILSNSGNGFGPAPVTISAGTLQVPSNGALGDLGNQVLISDSTLQTTSSFSSARLMFSPGTLATVMVDVGTTLTLSGVFGGSGALTKLGTGTLVLGNAGNSFGGPLSISAGTLQVASNGALGNVTNQLILNNGTLETFGSFTSPRAITSQIGGATIQVDLNTTLTLSGVISGSGALTKIGTGTLVLGGANTFGPASLTIAAGTLQVSNDTAFGDSANTVAINDATLQTVASFSSARSFLSQGSVASLLVNASTTLDLSTAVISGSGGLSKSGSGTLILGNAVNTFGPAPVTISGGTVRVDTDGALGNSGNQILLNQSTLQTTSSFASSRSFTSQVGGAFFLVDVSTTLNLSGVIDGVGGLTKSGAGTLILGGVNTFGPAVVTVSAGTLQVPTDTALGDSGNQIILNNSTLQSTGNFTSARQITSQSGGAIFLIDLSTTLNLTGVISGSGGLTKLGAGTLVLGNSLNSFGSGAVTVSAGTLQSANDGAFGDVANEIFLNDSTLQTTSSFASGRHITQGGTFANVQVDPLTTLTLVGRIDGTLTETGTGTLAYTFTYANTSPTVTAGKPQEVSDGNGGTTSVAVSGSGSVIIHAVDNGMGGQTIDTIVISGTTSSSTLFIKGPTTVGATTTINRIVIANSTDTIGSIVLGAGVILGDGVRDSVPDLQITGKVGSLQLYDLTQYVLIKLGENLPYNATGTNTPDTYNFHPNLKVHNVGSGVVIDVTGDGTSAGVGGGGLGKITVDSWSTAGIPGSIRTTQSITSFKLANGDCTVVFEVDKAHLGAATTAGVGSMSIQNGNWGSSGSEIEGGVKSFDADGFLSGATLTAASLGKVTIGANGFAGEIRLTDPDAPSLPSFTVASDFTGKITSANPISKLIVRGDFMGTLEAPFIGAITAYSFITATGVEMNYITATDGSLGTLTATAGIVKNLTIVTDQAFKGFNVKLKNLTEDTVGIENVNITARTIGNISVNLAAAATGAGTIDLVGIRDSTFVTTGTGTTKTTIGSIGNISVTLTGAAGGASALGIQNATFDALVTTNEFGTNPASTANLLGNITVTLTGQDGASLGLDDVHFSANALGTTTVSVTHGAALTATASAVDSAELTATGSIGALSFLGNSTTDQVKGLKVWAGANVGNLSVKSTNVSSGSLADSAILAGQSLALTGATTKELLAELSNATLGTVKISGAILNSKFVAGSRIGALTANAISDSIILAGARLGGDFLFDGDETYQRAASIASVIVKGALLRSSIVAGVDPKAGGFGDNDDATAAAAGILTTQGSIGAIVTGSGRSATVNLTHTNAIESASIKSLKLGTASALVNFSSPIFFGPQGAFEADEDPIVRLILGA